MSSADPAFHAFLIDRRAPLIERFAAGVSEQVPFYRDLPREVYLPGIERFVDAALEAVATGDPGPAVDQVASILTTRSPAGLGFEQALDSVSLFRRCSVDLAIEALVAGVPGAAEGFRFVERLNDTVVRRVASFYEGKLVAAERAALLAQEQYRELYDGLPTMLHSIDAEGRLVSVNDRWLEQFGYTREEVLGRRSTEFLTPESARYALEEVLPAYFRTGRADDVRYQWVRKDGSTMDVLLSAVTQRDADGKLVRSWAVLTDISGQLRAEEAHRLSRVQEEVIRNQQELLRALFTPLVPLGKGALLMPLVGAMDAARAEQMLAVLLDGVVAHAARFAILDVTGVPAMDVTVADALIRATRAVSLLGAEPILTGLGPDAARTLVEFGVDMGALVTRGTVRDGIAYALARGGGRKG